MFSTGRLIRSLPMSLVMAVTVRRRKAGQGAFRLGMAVKASLVMTRLGAAWQSRLVSSGSGRACSGSSRQFWRVWSRHVAVLFVMAVTVRLVQAPFVQVCHRLGSRGKSVRVPASRVGVWCGSVVGGLT